MALVSQGRIHRETSIEVDELVRSSSHRENWGWGQTGGREAHWTYEYECETRVRKRKRRPRRVGQDERDRLWTF